MKTLLFKIVSNNDNYENLECIERAINYIYATKDSKKKTLKLPIYCYGINPFPMSYDVLIDTFYDFRQQSQNVDEQHIWHFIVSFGISPARVSNPYFHLADSIARIFSPYYPICYSLHYDTDYLHCHYILSTTSGLPNVPSLSSNEFHGFFLKIQELVQSQGFELIINDEGGYLNV